MAAKKLLTLTLISIILLPLFTFSQELELSLLWRTNQKTFLESAATVADINNDGRDEVIIAGREELIALQKQGKELWRWDTRKRFITYPAVLKRDGQSALIYAADNSGLITCLDGKEGKITWQAELNDAAEWSASAVSDLDGDGIAEVIQTDIKGTVWVFNALTGIIKQQTKVNGKPASPALGDLDGDGKEEIVVITNEGILYAISGDGEILWERKIGGFSETWATSSPVIFAASDGKSYVAAASSSGEFYCLNGAGDIQWQHKVRGPVASTISVGDFDQNGTADIFLITQLGVIYRYDESGAVLWDIDMQGRSLAPGAIIDVNNDGKLEYVLSTQQGNFLALNNEGDIIFNHQFNTRTINVTPAFGDVARGTNDLEVVLTGGEAGESLCFGTPALKDSKKQWISYRGNHQNKGSWFGLAQSDNLRMIPQNLVWNKLFTVENIQFNVYNPTPGKEPLKATATCIRPDGSKLMGVSRIIGKKGLLKLPVTFDVPGDYKLSWTLNSSKGDLLFSDSRNITMQPFKNDRALVQQTIKELDVSANEIEKILPLSAKALRRQMIEIKTKSDALEPKQDGLPLSSGKGAVETLEATTEIVENAKRAMKISNAVNKAAALGIGTSIIAFEGDKWENRDVDKQLPKVVSNPVKISHVTLPGEHQPVPIMLFNITDQLLNVRVQINNTNNGIEVKPLRSVSTPTSMGNNSWDALPEMDESGVISIPALSSREVWLDIEIGDVQPGIHNLDILFYALNGATVVNAPNNPHAVPAPETKVELSLDILPFNMVPPGDFRLCTWSPSEGIVVDDLLAHGNNVFIVPTGNFQYNAKGELENIDFSKLDTILRQFADNDVFLLVYGFPEIKGEFGGASFKNDLKFYLDTLVNYMKNKGIDTDHFSLYSIDEPGGHGWDSVNKLVAYGEMVHEINDEIMIYMDGGGELPMFEAMAKVVDVWVTPFDWLQEEIPEMDVVRNNGKNLWSYNCTYSTSRPVGPNTKNINILYEYRTAALQAFSQGANGIGFWCYNAGRENPWMRIKNEYNLIYPGRTKPVTSRRWEAVREGIEDYRILAALQDYLENTNESSSNKEIRNKINHLVNVSLPELVNEGFLAMKIGLSRDAIDLASNENKMNTFRKEMMECVKEIGKN
jgi:outer membrane protein assembly factor BamB